MEVGEDREGAVVIVDLVCDRRARRQQSHCLRSRIAFEWEFIVRVIARKEPNNIKRT